uniref:Glycerate 2-kinase n=1 Tax=Pseudomonas aeruginosa TaxID=287 RepID=A0A5E5QWP9_PSEAI|nr:Glycerate 2-kinase [Pseudomonas aeruginosa]
MKIVIAPDSFKESLSAPDVAEAIARGWRRVFPQAEVLLRPLADGGEGTVDAVLAATAGERRECRVEGPLGEPTLAHWGWLDDATAVIEMASASGLHLVPRDRRDATRSSSRGTGELIRAALDAGARKIILGLGGSATNDAGAGLLGALGVRFLAADGEELAPGGAALAGLHSLDLGGLDPRLVDVAVEVAADVDNPLCGRAARRRCSVRRRAPAPNRWRNWMPPWRTSPRWSRRPLARTSAGCRASAPPAAWVSPRGHSSARVSAQASNWWRSWPGWPMRWSVPTVLTGEGRLDAQSLHGKTPVGVARIARQAGVPVVALAGSLGDGYQRLHDAGIDAAFSLAPGPISLEQACAGAAAELEARAEQIARLWRLAQASREG